MKDRDPFKEWRGQEGVIVLTASVPEGLEEEIAARVDGRRYPTFSILRAIPGWGCIEVAYKTADRLTIDHFSGGKGAGTWPVDLIMALQTLSSAVKSERDEQAEQRRKLLDEETFARVGDELMKAGVLFEDGPARRERMRRVN